MSDSITPAKRPADTVAFGHSLDAATMAAWQANAATYREQHEHEPSEYEFDQWRRSAKEKFERAGFPKHHVTWLRGWHRSTVKLRNAKWESHLEEIQGCLQGAGVTVALVGGRGTGKTQLATAVGWGVCYAGHNAEYKWAAALPRHIQATYANGAKLTEDQVLDRLFRVQLLIVDEVSVTTGSDFGARILSEVVCQRHDNERDTILISVQSEEEFAQSVGESITDRIAEGGGIYTFNWPSFRRATSRPAP